MNGRRRLAWLLGAALLPAFAPGAAAVGLDLSHNGVSAVWEARYGLTAYDPEADPDGDGMPTRMEAIAGTDPLDAASAPRISQIGVATNGVQAVMAGALGKLYQLQSSEVLGGQVAGNWTTVASLVARTNAVVTLEVPADLSSRFFRMVIADVDSDGDGLTDWEEYQLGLDPFSAYNNGQRDKNGQALTDWQYVTGRLASQTMASLLVVPPKSMPQKAGIVSNVALKSGVVVYPAATAAGTGLTAQYYTNSSSVYTNAANFNPAKLVLTTNDSVIDFRWGPATTPNLSNGLWSVRWTGQVQPQYSETYVFETRTDDGVKLWVNDQLLIDKWQYQGTTSWTNALTLQAGVRYNIRMEYFNGGYSARAQLYWYSASQPRQIIPATQLYPSADGLTPGGITSPLSAIAFLGQPFTFTVTAANSPLLFDATNVPPGLTFNSTNGLLSGVPGLAGGFDIGLAASNTAGIATAVMHLDVLDTGSAVTREVWRAVPGSSVTNIPLTKPATLTNTLGNLEGITNFGDNYGERIRGFLTAPVSGNYYFWLAANSSAELWISNDAEPVNKVRRAVVTKATTPRQWGLSPAQRSGWLSLVAGQRYYIEVLHKAGIGAGDHWSVGWLLDPSGTNTVPGGVVPGYVLSRYDPPALSEIPGTLYTANLLALPGVSSAAQGAATLRVSADGSMATLNFQINGLASAVSSEHIDGDPYLNHPAQLIFDISDTAPQADGSYLFNILPVGTLSAADVAEIIREGKASFAVHTANYPAGELGGHFTLANGSRTFTPPPVPPTWKDDHSNTNAAARFLLQSTFGPRSSDIQSVRTLGYSGWIDNQFARPVSGHLTNVYVLAASSGQLSSYHTFNTWWQQSVTAPDQLRQRVAFALSEILVVSEAGPLGGNPVALSAYYDLLLQRAFGNFRDLLKSVTLSPAMGLYLDMRGNDKGNLSTGTHPNENYAREIMQLFSIGLNRMWPDGTLVLNSNGELVPTYDQDTIIGYARVFTGWNYYQTNQANKRLPTYWYPSANYTNPMVLVPLHHELGTKRVLDNVILPPAQGSQADSSSTNFDAYCSQDLERAIDAIFNNQNVGPFICRQLIQRLVTSHPSRDYLYRVVQKFNDNGLGVRGDMKAVIKAILLDYEARSGSALGVPSFGKQREPLLRATAVARALAGPVSLAATYRQNGSQLVTVTTASPHRLSSSDSVYLNFTTTTGKAAPQSQIYSRVGVSNATTFVVTAPGLAVGTYRQSGSVITVTNSGHGLSAGEQIYLLVTAGGEATGVYTVAGVNSSSVFTLAAADSVSRTGTCVFPKWAGGSFVQSSNTITFTTSGPHGLVVGSPIYVDFPAGTESPDGVYHVLKAVDAFHFTVTSSISTNRYDNYVAVLPLSVPPVTRTGAVTIRYNNWGMNYTDTGYNSALFQTPLNSPTVFNFFFPDYKFPGVLASAGLTTPEFQLTSDTSAVLQMNFLSGGIFSSSSNTNGLSSFTSGSGAITLDLSPYMSAKYTTDAAIPSLVDAFNTLLCAGQLSPSAKNIIVGYVANTSRFPYTKPTATEMRDRVRAVAHLIITSPEFTIQR